MCVMREGASVRAYDDDDDDDEDDDEHVLEQQLYFIRR